MSEQGLTEVQELIRQECDNVRNLLWEKNRKYGNSALEPLRIFSRLDPLAQIAVRIDDKLSRLKNTSVIQIVGEDGTGGDGEDTVLDLIGYLILWRVAMKWTQIETQRAAGYRAATQRTRPFPIVDEVDYDADEDR